MHTQVGAWAGAGQHAARLTTACSAGLPHAQPAACAAHPPLPALARPPPAARESGHISGLVSLLNGKTGEVQRARPRCLLKGQSAVVEVTPARPLCLECYSDYRALGRVALRDGGRTIAVGVVTGCTPREAPGQ